LPDGGATRLKVRSLVGLLPLCATTVVEPWQRERVPRMLSFFQERLRQMPQLLRFIHPTGPGHYGVGERGIWALLTPVRLRQVLSKMLDEGEFLSPYGIRSLSKFHERHPYVFHVGGQEYRVEYLPAESDSGMFGGNSNWRGPIWFPVNALIIHALLQFYLYYGDEFRVERPAGSGKMLTLFEVAREITERLTRIFLRDERGRRPVYGEAEKFQSDPHWRDHLLFYEYFHGDNGAGVGASHQTGWTGLVATGIELFGLLDAKHFLAIGKEAVFSRSTPKRGAERQMRGDGHHSERAPWLLLTRRSPGRSLRGDRCHLNSRRIRRCPSVRMADSKGRLFPSRGSRRSKIEKTSVERRKSGAGSHVIAK